MTRPALVKRSKSFGGWTEFYRHVSETTSTEMKFALYRPPLADHEACPVVYFLSGLTCNEQNFITKAGAQRYAAELGLILVAPDTSPRGAGVPGEDESWDFGTGAGFYVDAITPNFRRHYRMYDYVLNELPRVVQEVISVLPGRQGITGHSMGGHGALVLGLRNPERYLSISAFSPIAAPTQCPWGEKAFTGYLGTDRDLWVEYDASFLIGKAEDKSRLILIDQGDADEFLHSQLKPDHLKQASAKAGYPLVLRFQAGYDHSYDFVATFIGEHLVHHARVLRNTEA